jgi:hypothetical protein
LFLFLFFLGLLNRQLCEFLTCERYQEFAGIPNSNSEMQVRKGLEVYLLMAVLTFGLAIVLIVIYFAMWLCFWQLESHSAPPLLQVIYFCFAVKTNLNFMLNFV